MTICFWPQHLEHRAGVTKEKQKLKLDFGGRDREFVFVHLVCEVSTRH